MIETLTQEDIDYIQTLIDYDDEIIRKGAYICGRNVSLDNEYIKRIRASTQREVAKVRYKYD